MISRAILEERLKFRKEALQEARNGYLALLSGRVQSYTIGSRSLTKFDITVLEQTITKWEQEVASLENQLAGTGKARKAVGVVPRDW